MKNRRRIFRVFAAAWRAAELLRCAGELLFRAKAARFKAARNASAKYLMLYIKRQCNRLGGGRIAASEMWR